MLIVYYMYFPAKIPLHAQSLLHHSLEEKIYFFKIIKKNSANSIAEATIIARILSKRGMTFFMEVG